MVTVINISVTGIAIIVATPKGCELTVSYTLHHNMELYTQRVRSPAIDFHVLASTLSTTKASGGAAESV